MATEPVARSRVVENEEVFDGYALERSCEGEQDEDFRAQTQHLLEQVYEAIELLERRWAKLCEHANYDRRKGQPVVVTTKDGKRRLPRRFKCRVHGAFLILLWFFSSRAVNSSNEHSCPTHTKACLSSSKSS